MCCHIYDWNIVNCDVQQPIHLHLHLHMTYQDRRSFQAEISHSDCCMSDPALPAQERHRNLVAGHSACSYWQIQNIKWCFSFKHKQEWMLHDENSVYYTGTVSVKHLLFAWPHFCRSPSRIYFWDFIFAICHILYYYPSFSNCWQGH